MSVRQAKSETAALIRLTITIIPIPRRKAGCGAAESVPLQDLGKSEPHLSSPTRAAGGSPGRRKRPIARADFFIRGFISLQSLPRNYEGFPRERSAAEGGFAHGALLRAVITLGAGAAAPGLSLAWAARLLL